jgi:ethanolamine kinase
LKNELESLEIQSKALNCPIVFSHNDLLCANIIFNYENKDVSFIDYEYGSYNYRSFDIANHFCEFGGFDCDYSLYPDESFQRQWIKEYLSKFSASPCTEQEINQVLKEVEIFNLVSHSFWCVWGLVQAHVSVIEFDYMAYAAKRFAEFKRRRDMLQIK